MRNFYEGCLTTILIFLGVLCFAAVLMVILYFATLLWNYVMPELFGVPEITYLKMLALMVLVWMIFPKPSITNNNRS